MSNIIPVKDLNIVVDILSKQCADLNKTNACLNAMVIEKNEEIVDLKKQLEDAITKKVVAQ